MKKTIIIISLLIISICLKSQITSINVISKKNYEDQTTTSYCSFSGYLPQSILSDLCTQLEMHPDIIKFSFYDNTNKRNFMCTTNATFDIQIISDLINDFIQNIIEFDNSNNLANTEYFEENKVVKFIVQGIDNEQHKNSIQEQISTNNGIISIEINPDNICKLTITKNISKQYITGIFESYSLSILEIYHD